MHLMKMLEELKRKGFDGEYGEEVEELMRMSSKKLKFMEHESKYGPHFNEEYAHKAVREIENEDGTTGPHWSVEETTNIANQYGINVKSGELNKWDWYVVLNAVYSDFYRAVVTMTNSDNIKYFVELAKAWAFDKDAPKGKMWYYYVHIMNCDKDEEEYEDEFRHYARGRRGRSNRMSGRMMGGRYFEEDSEMYDEPEREYHYRRPSIYDKVGNYYYRRY